MLGFDGYYFDRRRSGGVSSSDRGYESDRDGEGGKSRRRRVPLSLSIAGTVIFASVASFIAYRLISQGRANQHKKKMAQLEADHQALKAAAEAASLSSSSSSIPSLLPPSPSTTSTPSRHDANKADTITVVMVIGDAHLVRHTADFVAHMQKIFERSSKSSLVNLVLLHFYDEEKHGTHTPCSILQSYRRMVQSSEHKVSYAQRIDCFAIDKKDLVIDRGSTRQGASPSANVKKFIEQTDSVARFRLLKSIAAARGTAMESGTGASAAKSSKLFWGKYLLWMDSDVELVRGWDVMLLDMQKTANASVIEMEHKSSSDGEGSAIITCWPPLFDDAQALADSLREKRRLVAEEEARRKQESYIASFPPAKRTAAATFLPAFIGKPAGGKTIGNILDTSVAHWCPGTWQRFGQWHPVYGTPEPSPSPLFFHSTIAMERDRPVLSPWFCYAFAFGLTDAFVTTNCDPRLGPSSSAVDFIQLMRLWCNRHRTFVPPVVVAVKRPSAWSAKTDTTTRTSTHNDAWDADLIKASIQQYKAEIEARILNPQGSLAPSRQSPLLVDSLQLASLVRLSSIDWLRRGISAEGALGVTQHQATFLKERDILIKYGESSTYKRALAEMMDFMVSKVASSVGR
jgi:hypothetical protein